MKITRYALFVALFAALATPSILRADSFEGYEGYTYSYTGNTMNLCLSTPCIDDAPSVSGSFLVVDPLTPSTSQLVSPKYLSFCISSSSGPCWTNSDSNVTVAVTTDASDDIINWLLNLSDPAGSVLICDNPSQTPPNPVYNCYGPDGSGDSWAGAEGYPFNDSPGTWLPPSYSAPEPSTLEMLAAALATMALVRLRWSSLLDSWS
jgi:hypothetical protein